MRFSPHHVEAQNKNAGDILANLFFFFVFRYHEYMLAFVYFSDLEKFSGRVVVSAHGLNNVPIVISYKN